MYGACFILTLGLIATFFCLYYAENRYSAIAIFMLTIISATTVGCLGSRHEKVADNITADVLTQNANTMQQHLLQTVNNQIKRQESFEKLYNSQRPLSAYVDAIDYTDLYAIKDMIANTTNPDSLKQLGNLLFDTVYKLDNETKELFKHDGIKM